MSYAAYVKEREGLETLETKQGFVLYKIREDECYLQDIYVNPDFRKQGVAASMADIVAEKARSAGCCWLVGSVAPKAANAHSSLLVLLAYGMELKKAEKDMIYFAKRIA